MPRRLIGVVTMALLAIAAPAFAGPGLQLGFSTSPDDFLVGFHFRSHPVADHLEFVPSVEAGFGDATMIAGNADFHYLLQVKSDLRPYLGGGFTVNWFDTDPGSETDFGGSILGGLHLNQKLFLELKFGLGDVPDLKFILGFTR